MSLDDFVEDIRHEVIDDAVSIEHLISHYLAKSLNIRTENPKNKLPLHFLDFIQKGQILREMETVTHDQFIKIQLFAEIRNVFAHNFSITTLEEYFALYPDREKKLLKFYSNEGQMGFEKEIVQYNLYLRLVNDLKFIAILQEFSPQ